VSRAKLPIVDKTSEHFDAIKNLGRANESTYGVSRTYRRSASLLRRLFGTTYDPVAVVKDKIRLPDKDRERIARRYALDYELFDYALPHGEAVLHL
jgi:hypothetical protein